jgi:hypothetical protein
VWRVGGPANHKNATLALTEVTSLQHFLHWPTNPTTFKVPHGKISVDYEVATTLASRGRMGNDNTIDSRSFSCSSWDSDRSHVAQRLVFQWLPLRGI